ncbi:MAG: GNAT family N-acetyltransferase [Oscillospiraceae bacterium]|nr:GNAT family N-acetyltransferase [Oscillospiraceae bacterium]
MIKYRKLTPEEKLYVNRMQNIAFSNHSATEESIREKIAKGEYDSENTYGAVDENGRVIAGMEVIPYVMWFDGHKTDMYGIGGVVSAPESKRQGNVRKIFEKAFDDIYQKGAVFSHLYPFSHDYYRKFGYEAVGGANKYTLNLEAARKLKSNGSAHEFIKGGDAKDKLTEVYENYASRHNIMLSRSSERWNEVLDIALFGPERLFYWKDENDNIKSWVKFKKDGDVMNIIDIAWTDCGGMLGILQFMGMFDGAAEKLRFRASPEFIPELYWNDLYDIEISADWLGMNRIVDAKRALELIKKPEREGKFTVKVSDKFALWNNNIYSVEYGGGECKVKTVDGNTETADLETSELSLMLMILGVYDFKYISRREDVRVNNNFKTLEKIFRKKNLLITDFF